MPTAQVVSARSRIACGRVTKAKSQPAASERDICAAPRKAAKRDLAASPFLQDAGGAALVLVNVCGSGLFAFAMIYVELALLSHEKIAGPLGCYAAKVERPLLGRLSLILLVLDELAKVGRQLERVDATAVIADENAPDTLGNATRSQGLLEVQHLPSHRTMQALGVCHRKCCLALTCDEAERRQDGDGQDDLAPRHGVDGAMGDEAAPEEH